jgi:hypothetical protein
LKFVKIEWGKIKTIPLILDEQMTKEFFRNFFLAVILGVGFSFFICTEYLGVWSTSMGKGLAALIGIWILFAALIFGRLQIRQKQIANRHSTETDLSFFVLLIALVGIGLLIFPISAGKTPDDLQTLIIKPIQEPNLPKEANRVLVEEIKLNGNPIPLNDIKPSSGWISNTYGLESEPGTSIPLVLRNSGKLQSDIQVLFGKGPDFSAAQIRIGWDDQQIELYQSGGESEIIVSVPANTFRHWGLVSWLSFWISISGILFVLGILFLPVPTIGKVCDRLFGLTKSVLFWIIFSFLFWYGFSFVRMVFLNPSNVMMNENFLPAIRPIGNDLNYVLDAGKSLLHGLSPYTGPNKYPPAAVALFLPLTFLSPRSAFQFLSVISYLFFCFITLGFPYGLTRLKRLPEFAWILFVAGLYSYGLLFEIERGQFNLIAIGCVFSGILIFHRQPKLRWLAFILFCVSVQLKIYPAIFVIFFSDDWENWKRNIVRWMALGLANLALLFALGPAILQQFLVTNSDLISSLGKTDWPVSHSIDGFLMFANYYFNFPDNILNYLQIFIYLVVLSLIGFCFFLAWRKKTVLDPALLLACTIGALTIPSLSNDYTLAYLVGPGILFVIAIETLLIRRKQSKGMNIRWIVILTAISTYALSATFFSYLQKPLLLQNQFPNLVLLLLCAAGISWLEFQEKGSLSKYFPEQSINEFNPKIGE